MILSFGRDFSEIWHIESPYVPDPPSTTGAPGSRENTRSMRGKRLPGLAQGGTVAPSHGFGRKSNRIATFGLKTGPLAALEPADRMGGAPAPRADAEYQILGPNLKYFKRGRAHPRQLNTCPTAHFQDLRVISTAPGGTEPVFGIYEGSEAQPGGVPSPFSGSTRYLKHSPGGYLAAYSHVCISSLHIAYIACI